MKRIPFFVSLFFDWVARAVIALVMVLIVGNVILRIFGKAYGGTIEWVGFCTAIAVGLSLSYCAYKEGHIEIPLFVEMLSPKLQKVLDCIVKIFSAAFLIYIFFRLLSYAENMRSTGQVSLTTHTSYYPFVIIVAVGFLAYSLIVLSSIVENRRR